MNILHTFPFDDYNLYLADGDFVYPSGHITIPLSNITTGHGECPNLKCTSCRFDSDNVGCTTLIANYLHEQLYSAHPEYFL